MRRTGFDSRRQPKGTLAEADCMRRPEKPDIGVRLPGVPPKRVSEKAKTFLQIG